MIPVKDVTKITDHMGGEKTVMSVNPDDWKKISGLLINLYSDTVLAVVREYSTNAHDAHIEAGITEPILISTPNQFNNLFVVEDKGTGMTKETLQQVYGMFGASTKDTSNDFNGSMGLGSKSALTYTDSFTVISTKDGVTTTAIVGRDEEGNGIMEILSESNSGAENGTIVQIPAKSGDEYLFERKAREFYQWWPEGSVLVNRKEPERIDLAEDGYEEILPDTWISTAGYGSSLTIVMGNVAYKHHFSNPPQLATSVDIVFFAPNGVVQFSPSRESLLMNKATTKYVEALIEQTVEAFVQQITDKIANAASLQDAIEAYKEYDRILNDGITEWNGIALKTRSRYGGRQYRVHYDDTSKVDYVQTDWAYKSRVAFLENFNGQGLSRVQKNAIREYNSALDEDEKIGTLLYAGFRDPIFKDARTVDWEDIKPLVKKGGQAKAALATFDIFYYDDTEQRVKRDVRTLPPGKKYLYTSPTDIRGGWDNDFYSMAWLSEMRNAVVVVISTNRHAKFRKDYPGSRQLHEYINEWADNKCKKVTADERRALEYGDRQRQAFKRFAGKTDDPFIDKVAESLVSYTKRIQKVETVTSGLRLNGPEYRIGTPNTYYRDTKDYFGKTYPLVESDYGQSDKYIDHEIKYINMIYGEKKND